MVKSKWDVFRNWDYQLPYKIVFSDKGWSVFDQLIEKSEKCYEMEKIEIISLLDEWNVRLKDYGGDSTYHNWNKFRPLRLDREEDWSDWLEHLVVSSKTGFFSRILFKLGGLSKGNVLALDFAEREPSYKGYRGDLVIKWKNGIYVHVEVKTGDPNLKKTYNTARRMRDKYRAEDSLWRDFILLLSSQASQWLDIKDAGATKIAYLTWEDVAISIRKSLLFSAEPVSWKAWAYSFLGAIEQKLLRHPYIDVEKKRISNNYVLNSMIQILREGMKNEE